MNPWEPCPLLARLNRQSSLCCQSSCLPLTGCSGAPGGWSCSHVEAAWMAELLWQPLCYQLQASGPWHRGRWRQASHGVSLGSFPGRKL